MLPVWWAYIWWGLFSEFYVNTTRSHSLDCLITENEIRKNNNSHISDKIKSEMTKSSLNELMPVYLKLFNTVFDLGTMPQTWDDGLITPSFKFGTKNDP